MTDKAKVYDDPPIHNLKIGQGIEGVLTAAKIVRAKTQFPDSVGDGKSFRTVLTGTWDGLGVATVFVSHQVARFGTKDGIFGALTPWEGGDAGTGTLTLTQPDQRVRIERITKDGKQYYNLRHMPTASPDPSGDRLARAKAEYEAALAAAEAKQARPTGAGTGPAPAKASAPGSKPSTAPTPPPSDFSDFPDALDGDDDGLPF